MMIKNKKSQSVASQEVMRRFIIWIILLSLLAVIIFMSTDLGDRILEAANIR